MDGSVVFTRWRQYAPHWHLHYTSSARCWGASIILTCLGIGRLGFYEMKFLIVCSLKCVIVLNFIAIWSNIAELWRFNIFWKMAAVHHIVFLRSQFLNCRYGSENWCMSTYKIFWTSVKPLCRHYHFLFVKMAATYRVGFQQFTTFYRLIRLRVLQCIIIPIHGDMLWVMAI